MIGRCLTVALLGSLLAPASGAAQEVKRLEADEAKKIAQVLTDASSKLDNPALKVAPAIDKSMGLTSNNRGALIVPDSRLTIDSLKNLDKEIVPLGLLYVHRLTPVVADQSVPEDQHRTVEVTIKDKSVKLAVLHLGAAKVADRLVLIMYAGGKAPVSVTTLVEANDAKDHPLDLEARKAGDSQATIILTVLGHYRAAFNIAGQD